uniref:Cupin type-1 domain-containing protein n=1 Tax=Bionectria ochroleuca TaxID=29856 RepID=A0A8H7KC52_BIOOC
MSQVQTYHLPPTDLVPNSPRPLIHYKNVLPRVKSTGRCSPGDAWQMFEKNGWRVNWLVRYGHTQMSHFHSQAHETMAVLSGTATIRFGVGDTSDDLHANTHGDAWEKGGVTLQAEAGDVFVIPAGVAHKTHNTLPKAAQTLLSPGTGHGIEADDPKKALSEIELDGFTMMGAYNNGEWDFVVSGGDYEQVWATPKPLLDPVFADSPKGLRGLWRGSGEEMSTTSNRISRL